MYDSVIRIRNRKRNKTSLLYLMLLPFLFPRGFAEYFPWYHSMQRYILAFATVLIFGYFLFSLTRKKTTINTCISWVLMYHIGLLLITVLIQGGISEGIQKVFFTPVFFILCMEQMKKNWRYFLNAFSNILLGLFLLNITIFNQWIFPQYFLVSQHITFIGHVQVVSQLGILSILIGVVTLSEKRKKSIVLIILGVLNMLYSMTLVSYITLIILAVGIIIIKKTKGEVFNKPLKFFVIPQIISVLLIILTRVLKGFYFINAIDISMSGRMIIWNAILEKLEGHLMFGYGAFGTLFKVFWNQWYGNPNGSNYAHSELLQLLLDGGIVLLSIYLFMMISCIKRLDRCKNTREKRIAVLLLGAFSIVAVIESVTEYYYYFGFLAIVASLYMVINEKSSAIIGNNFNRK